MSFAQVTEAVAFVLGILTVWLTLKQNMLCWPIGVIQPVFALFTFFSANLLSDGMLQVIFIILQIYGWIHWKRGGTGNDDLPVTTLTPLTLAACVAAVFAFTAGWGWIMATYTKADAVLWDSFIVGASLVAQWLLTLKKLESWIFWIVVDVVSIGLFFAKGLILMAVLYLVFLVLATAGFVEWRKSRQQTLALETA